MSGIYETPDGQKVHGDGKPIGHPNELSSLDAPAGSTNLPCPFCGSPCDDCRGGENDEDGWLGCENNKCPASRLVMTAEQWNTRYSPNDGTINQTI